MSERHSQSVTVSAKTVDDAIAEAERELGVSRDNLDITVITEGSKGFLGMRAENARILAMVVGGTRATATEASVAEEVRAGAPSTSATAPVGVSSPIPTSDGAPAPPVTSARLAVVGDGDGNGDGNATHIEAGAEQFGLEDEYDDEEPLDGDGQPLEPGRRARQQQETAAAAQEILETLLQNMDIRAHVRVRTVADPIVLDVETDNGGLLIGRRGETLSALQYLVNVLIGKRTRRWTKVVIDVEHWRDRREDTLRALALRQADRVRQQQRPVALDPMPANERRIVHMALQDQRDIETHSEGEEPNRRLVITPKR
jgi:spoIIIJ-associated protein